MKKVILILIFCGVNIFLFQNFTELSDEQKESWGQSIEETSDDPYNDFQSALANSSKDLEEKKAAWSKDLEENEEAQEDTEVGVITDPGYQD